LNSPFTVTNGQRSGGFWSSQNRMLGYTKTCRRVRLRRKMEKVTFEKVVQNDSRMPISLRKYDFTHTFLSKKFSSYFPLQNLYFVKMAKFVDASFEALVSLAI
jgi:hypothetical protein